MTKKIFETIKSYEDFKNALVSEENIDTLMDCYMDEASKEAGIVAINALSKDQQKFILKYIHHVDSKFNVPNRATNKYHKIPVVIAGCIFHHQFFDQTKHLTCDELGILSKFSAVFPLSEYDELVRIFDKPLLSTIASKITNADYREDIAILAYERINAGQNKESMIKYIAGTEVDEVLNASFEIQRELERGETPKYESR